MTPNNLSKFLEISFKNCAPILIKGAPGVGKSDIVSQAAENAGFQLIIEHPVVSDPTDYKGLPFPIKRADGKASAAFLPFGNLTKIISAQEPTVFFLDDLGQAPPAVQAACMQLLLARRINGHKVSPKVCFAAATNRKRDRAGVSGMLEPVKSRFASIIELEPTLDDWVKWALSPKGNMPTELISFLRFRPGLLFDFTPTSDMTNSPCPRTAANVGRLMAMKLPPEIEYEAYSGAAGEGFAAELMGFLKIFRSLPSPDRILMDPGKADVPTDPATLYALCGALARKASDQTASRLFEYYGRLPAEFSVLAVRDSVNACPNLVETRGFIEWSSKNSDVLI
jgi:hypothetical protein